MASRKYAVANKDRCVACGACIRECSQCAITIVKGCYADINKDACVGCGKCYAVCPVGCIDLKPREAGDA